MNYKLLFLFLVILSCSSDSNENSVINQNEQCEAFNQNTSANFFLSNEEQINSFLAGGYSEVNNIVVRYQSNLSFLNCIEKLNALDISACSITSLNGLSNLQELQFLRITDCANLVNLNGIGSVQSLDRLEIEYNNSLLNFQGLESLTSISGIWIRYNDSIESFEGLENITENPVAEENQNYRSWTISSNPNLLSISALNNVSGELKATVFLYNNPILNDLGSFDQLNVGSNSAFTMTNCHQVQALNCFPNITDFNSINVSYNNSLQSVSFPSLTRTTKIYLYENDVLNNLNFSSLTELYSNENGNQDPNIEIDNNDSLISLNGFENLISNAKNIEINTSYSQFDNPIRNICSLRNLIAARIYNGNLQNEIYFKTNCYNHYNFDEFNSIDEFDAICNCD